MIDSMKERVLKCLVCLMELVALSSCVHSVLWNNYWDNIPPTLQTKHGDNPVIMFIGDSRAELGGTFDGLDNTTYNTGAACRTTRGIINYQLDYVQSVKPDYVFIFTGVNDANISSTEFTTNLGKIVDTCKDTGANVIILDISIDFYLAAIVCSASDYKRLIENRIIMQLMGVDYIAIDYVQQDFENIWHLKDTGYVKVTQAIKDYIANNQ